jgi:hypothetical protein
MRAHHFQSSSGTSFVETLFGVGLLAVCVAIALPSLLAGLDEVRTAGAVRYLSAQLQRARMQAIARTADTAVRFTSTNGLYSYGVFVDGNRNGIRTADVDAGIDARLGPPEQLADHFPGVGLGALPGLPPVDVGGTPPGDDPVRLGVSDSLTFTPRGTATAGSLYILGRGRTQYAIRIYGETGRTRALKFHARQRRWRAL